MEFNENKKTFSERGLEQLKKFDTYKNYIEQILKKIEKDYEIKIFFVCETGSKGIGNDVNESDFDITGFFVPLNEL